MMLFNLFGFVFLCALALYFTVGFISIAFGEILAGELTWLTLAFGAITVSFWAMTWWLSPFSLTINIAS